MKLPITHPHFVSEALKLCAYLKITWRAFKKYHITTQSSNSMFRQLIEKNESRDLKQVSVQSLSRVQLCDPMDYSAPGLPIHHQLPEFTQTHVHHVGDAIQPSHPLSSHSPPAFNLSQHQGLFQ